MGALRAGFARVDVTPPLGAYMAGYYEPRVAEGVLDPLQANAISFSDGEREACLIVCDMLGIPQAMATAIRERVAAAIGARRECVFLSCTHAHTGPVIKSDMFPHDEAYNERLAQLLAQAAVLAKNDQAPAKLLAAKGSVEGISFIRRFRMKDGTIRTNPGRRNPDIDAPIGTPDESLTLVRVVREGAEELVLVSFQVHPDVVSGCRFSADYPGFVRRTLEGALPGARAVYLNGAAGNLNHIDVNAPEWDKNGGYEHAAHMGRRIAGAALGIYTKARPVEGSAVDGRETQVQAPANKADPTLLPRARQLVAWHDGGHDELIPEHGMGITTLVAEARRMLALADAPERIPLTVTALRVGEVCVAGLPGEPFTEIGRHVKANSPFAVQLASGLSNGDQGYFPMRDAYAEGGYEARSSSFCAGVGEALAEAAAELTRELYGG